MKILNITGQKPHSTGSGTYLTELVKSFDKLGHKQAVVAGVYPSDSANFPNDVKFYPVTFSLSKTQSDTDLDFPICGMSDIMPYQSTRYRDMTAKMIETYEQAFISVIAKAIEELEPDLILCHHLFLLTSIVRKHFPDQRIYAVCHGTCLRQMRNAANSETPWSIDIEEIRKNIANLDKILALHSAQAEEIAEIFGNDVEIQIIGSGYNPDLFNTDKRIERCADDPVRVIYAGKISSPKGIPELLDALDIMTGNFEITFVGGCQEEDLKTRVLSNRRVVRKASQNRPEIRILPQWELAEEYKKQDVLVLPSYFEGLSLVPIEAMASGLIPVCTDLPGMRDWIDANVTNPNIRYIPMPEMAGIDYPTEEGRKVFVQDIAAVLGKAIEDIVSAKQSLQPDTSKITWIEVAKKVIS